MKLILVHPLVHLLYLLPCGSLFLIVKSEAFVSSQENQMYLTVAVINQTQQVHNHDLKMNMDPY